MMTFIRPTPKVVSASPVTFWLDRSVTVRKLYSRPHSPESSSAPRMPSRTIRKPGIPLFPIMFSTRHPPAPPMHMMPGMPRFRCPAFSVRISPVEPYMNVAPKARESIRKPSQIFI